MPWHCALDVADNLEPLSQEEVGRLAGIGVYAVRSVERDDNARVGMIAALAVQSFPSLSDEIKDVRRMIRTDQLSADSESTLCRAVRAATQTLKDACEDHHMPNCSLPIYVGHASLDDSPMTEQVAQNDIVHLE